ncbi:hypothetical protein GGS24DRAFT_470864 [Hypoxylon argillaceum]|nr:hypothetical protein GGS24DRAFT_470864 [Hypoxylon argillaceum]
MSENRPPERAAYGCLAFDSFVLAKWDHLLPLGRNQEQWNKIARQWLALTPIDRLPYHRQAFEQEHAITASSPSLEVNRVEHLLAAHQTLQERSLTITPGPAWVRTCYSLELADAYAAISRGVDDSAVNRDSVLDDEVLYDGMELSQILLRIPALPDKDIGYAIENDVDDSPRVTWGLAGGGNINGDDEESISGLLAGDVDVQLKRPVYEAQREIATVLYLVDERALRAMLIRVLWLDVHGRCVWDNTIRTEDLLPFNGHLFNGLTLVEFVDGFAADSEGSRRWERGATFKF